MTSRQAGVGAVAFAFSIGVFVWGCVSSNADKDLTTFANDIEVLADGVANVDTLTSARLIKLKELAEAVRQTARAMKSVTSGR